MTELEAAADDAAEAEAARRVEVEQMLGWYRSQRMVRNRARAIILTFVVVALVALEVQYLLLQQYLNARRSVTEYNQAQLDARLRYDECDEIARDGEQISNPRWQALGCVAILADPPPLAPLPSGTTTLQTTGAVPSGSPQPLRTAATSSAARTTAVPTVTVSSTPAMPIAPGAPTVTTTARTTATVTATPSSTSTAGPPVAPTRTCAVNLLGLCVLS